MKKEAIRTIKRVQHCLTQTQGTGINSFPKHKQSMIRKFNRKKEPIRKSNKTIKYLCLGEEAS